MASKTIYMESTEIAAARTAAEISSCLIQSGATQIATDYKESRVTGLRWVMLVNGNSFMFSMPARVEPLFKLLLKRRTRYVYESDKQKIREQAERVAWRQLLRWVQAQLAMIETGMVEAQEVFLPYMQDQDGRTVYQVFSETRFKALSAPEVK